MTSPFRSTGPSTKAVRILESVSVNHLYWLILALLTLVGAFFRLKGLTFQSYWLDEIYTLAAARPDNSFYDMLGASLQSDVHPPLNNFLLWLWFHCFGFTETSGRTYAALLGTACIPAIYVLGKELFNERVGVYAAAILSFNVFLIFHSQDIRPYSLFLLLTLVSFLFYARTLSAGTYFPALGYACSTVALLYTHYFSFIVVLTQFLFLFFHLVTHREHVRRLLVIAVACAAAFSASLLPILPSILVDAGRTTFWIPLPEADSARSLASHYFGGSLNIVLLIVLLVVTSFAARTRTNAVSAQGLGFSLAVLWLVLSFLVPYIKSLVSLPVLIARSTIILVPPLVYLAADGLDNINERIVRWTLIVTLVVLSTANLFWERDYYNTVTKDQIRPMVRFVHEEFQWPVYVMNDRAASYNAYEAMLYGQEVIRDGTELRRRLSRGTAGPCFWWMARPLFNQQDKFDALGLIRVDTIEENNMFAALMSTSKENTRICRQNK